MIGTIILAAGKSSRLSKDINTKKQFLKTNGNPLFMDSVKKFLEIENIDHIILIIDEVDKKNESIQYFVNSDLYNTNKSKIFITFGGENRYDSVKNSFLYIDKNLRYSYKDKILVHDSARPFVNLEDIKKLILALDKVDAVSLGGKIINTIKKIECLSGNDLVKIKNTEDRNEFLEVYTPQGFKYGVIRDAYEKLFNDTYDNRLSITDDLQVVEKYLKKETFLLDSNRHNIKITTKEDLIYL